MPESDLLFVIWWYGVASILAVATWVAMRHRERFEYEEVLKSLLFGVAAALALFLIPSGLGSVESLGAFKLRFFAALGIAWLVAMRFALARRSEAGFSGLALAAFIGVNVPPLALVASATMVCGGEPSCL